MCTEMDEWQIVIHCDLSGLNGRVWYALTYSQFKLRSYILKPHWKWVYFSSLVLQQNTDPDPSFPCEYDKIPVKSLF